ncbi:DUF1178 family protein [Accumulibacter sp.]|uniref:DUF1178 family protein n=1 Tax=Accumulibacter sp. TaxID=2053492 RepID=UPI0025F8E014|nr:DUF1178 family protein [Accumulibacter sp.]MCM8596336.1 DUF1178 family protein [Accumulibacter sp.]MCM8627470.1 DUF1178 family protein [Accumulibacter sp.]MDS4050485.1 DUF1178 family protein [Accumulibacter sp.]
MIIFDLACPLGHRFEGWFHSREDFDSQLERRLINCPHCASLEVRRVPSNVHLSRQAATPAPVETADSEAAVVDLRAGVLNAFRQLTEMLLARCEDVGENFAEEARRIHYVEAPERSIRGVATSEEYESLVEEGIEVFRIGRLKPGDLH